MSIEFSKEFSYPSCFVAETLPSSENYLLSEGYVAAERVD